MKTRKGIFKPKSSGSGFSELLDLTRPVNSLFFSVDDTDPNVLFGGTWVRFAKGKVLVGVDEDDPDFNAPNKEGGTKVSKNVSHSHTFSGTSVSTSGVGDHSHSERSAGSHKHTFNTVNDLTAQSGSLERVYQSGWTPEGIGSRANENGTRFLTGSNAMGEAGGHTHTINGSGSHNHSVTAEGTISSSGDLSATNNGNLQPFITCYIWVRTA